MVDVLVCDKNGGEIFRHATDAGEPLANLPTAETNVHEQTRFVGFNVRRVAIGTTAENRKLHCHPQTLKVVTPGGNAFSARFFRLRFGGE